jgi:hypothetical protein
MKSPTAAEPGQKCVKFKDPDIAKRQYYLVKPWDLKGTVVTEGRVPMETAPLPCLTSFLSH